VRGRLRREDKKGGGSTIEVFGGGGSPVGRTRRCIFTKKGREREGQVEEGETRYVYREEENVQRCPVNIVNMRGKERGMEHMKRGEV